MPASQQWCEQCGAPLPEGARFCEVCGAPVGSPLPQQAEAVIGHLPAEAVQEGKGFLGRSKTIPLSLILTTSRLLLLREDDDVHDLWVGETERLIEEEEHGALSWRELIDRYPWRSPLWARFFDTPPDDLLAAHRDNEAIPLTEVVWAAVTLGEGGDRLYLQLAGGQARQMLLLNQVGRVAVRFLAQALGPERVRLAPPAAA